MTFASATHFHVYLLWGQRLFSTVSYLIVSSMWNALNAFNQEKALEGAFSVISNLWMELFEALLNTRTHHRHPADGAKN